jgi:uncharacterized integral membrane protein
MVKKIGLKQLIIGLSIPIDLGHIKAAYGEGLLFGVFTAILLLMILFVFLLSNQRKNKA